MRIVVNIIVLSQFLPLSFHSVGLLLSSITVYDNALPLAMVGMLNYIPMA